MITIDVAAAIDVTRRFLHKQNEKLYYILYTNIMCIIE